MTAVLDFLATHGEPLVALGLLLAAIVWAVSSLDDPEG